MQENHSLLHQLEQMLSWKKSKSFYAKKLNITEEEVEDLIKELRNKDSVRDEAETAVYVSALEEHVVEVNNERGTVKSTIETTFEPKDDLELAKLHKINLDKYKISNYWTKQKSNGKFTSSVFATLKKSDDYTIEDFAEFLQNYKPSDIIIRKVDERNYTRQEEPISGSDCRSCRKS